MNREIKFRAWDKKLKQWASVGFHVFGETTLFNLLQQYCFETKAESSSLDRLLNDIEVTQYIGKNDDNGVDIYEGDILKYSYHRDISGNDSVEFTEVVEWDENKIGFLIHQNMNMQRMEVVGNIYEHSYLLNKEQSVKESDTSKAT